MIFKTEHADIDLSALKDRYNAGFRKWGIKLSGGADSALVAYMLVHIIQENGWDDVSIWAITGVSDIKPYNAIYAKKVMDKITELTGFEFAGHHYGVVSASNGMAEYAGGQEQLVQELFKNGSIDFRFAGITANPPKEGDSSHLWNRTDGRTGPADSDFRDKSDEPKSIINRTSSLPLINTDKRGVAELYDYFGITDTLFPVTRSCEGADVNETESFTRHCGKCWFCLEREWGFGKLV